MYRGTDAVLVGARLGLDRERDRGLGKMRQRVMDRRRLVTERIAGERVLQFGDRAEIPGVQFGHRRRRFALHHLHVLQALGRAAREILQRRVVLQHAGHHLEIADAPGEGIGQRLVHEDRYRLGVAGFPVYLTAFAADLGMADSDAAFGRIGKHIDQEIEQRAAADVVQRRGQHHRIDALGLKSFAQPFHQVLHRQRAFLEEFLHQRVVALGHHLHQRFVRHLGGFGEFRGNLFDFRLAVAVGRVHVRLHGDQVDHAAKIFLRADRQLHGNHVAAKHARDRLHGAFVARQLTVHPVDRERARQVVLGRVVPDLLRYHLHARERVHHDQRRVGRHQRRARIVDERAVARRVQKINSYFFRLAAGRPFGVGLARVNRDLPRDFFLVPVRDRVSFGDLPQPGGHPRGKQQRRHQLGFPRVAVTGNTHIAYGLRCIGFHRATPWRGGLSMEVIAAQFSVEGRRRGQRSLKAPPKRGC